MKTKKQIQELLPLLQKNKEELLANYERIDPEQLFSASALNLYATINQLVGQILAFEWILAMKKKEVKVKQDWRGKVND